MLATEQEQVAPDNEQTPAAAPASLLEVWTENETMRHVPTLAWLVEKLDIDVRKRIDLLFAPYAALSAGDPRHAPLEAEFRALCRAVDRVAEVARRSRAGSHPPNDLSQRMGWAISNAITSLNSSDRATFGRRHPFQTFERSNSEPLYAAMLVVIQRLHHLEPLVREIDPGLDERLYEGLVKLNEPLRTDAIA